MKPEIWRRISSIHPSYFAGIYFSAILLFPLLYTYINAGFYAPYVHLEPSAKADEYQAGQLIQAAWRDALRKRLANGPVTIDGMAVQPEDLSVQQFKASEDGTMRFNASVTLHRPNDGLEQAYFPVTINGDDVRLEAASNSQDRFVRPVFMGNLDALYGEAPLARISHTD